MKFISLWQRSSSVTRYPSTSGHACLLHHGPKLYNSNAHKTCKYLAFRIALSVSMCASMCVCVSACVCALPRALSAREASKTSMHQMKCMFYIKFQLNEKNFSASISQCPWPAAVLLLLLVVVAVVVVVAAERASCVNHFAGS